MKKVELLIPVKNIMAIKASAPYADAIYFGVEDLNMRMKADNFKVDQISKIVEMCHNPRKSTHRKRKVYLTLNILIYENELGKLEKIINIAKNAKVDAVIVHDLAGIQLSKKIGIPFHISTQCNVSNSLSAQYYESIGAERIILARECSLEQIKEIIPKLSKAKIETFIHGAMCSSISGRCYLSQTIACTNKNSANRGLCTQPCRGIWTLKHEKGNEFIYDGQRIFNSRDLCMINYIPQLIESGIKSFKIEGRMRHPHYVEVVSRCYREAIDAYYSGNFEAQKKQQRWITQLKEVYNRGFTTGFFFNMASAKDSQLRSPANISHFRYIEMGKIISYFPTNVAKIQLTNGTLKIDDEIIVMSTDNIHDTYFTQKITDIQNEGKNILITQRATKNHPQIITIKMNQKAYGDKIDTIFKFTDETYKKPEFKKKKKKNNYLLK